MRPTTSSSKPSITWCRWRSSAAVAIHTAQHHRLAHMRGANGCGAVEIGYGARQPEHPLAPPSRESALLHRRLEQPPPGLIRHAPALHALIREARIAPLLAGELHGARAGDAGGSGERGFPTARGGVEIGGGQPRHLYVHVQPVEQGSGNAAPI